MEIGFNRGDAEQVIAEAKLEAMESLLVLVIDQLEAGIDQETIVQQLMKLGPDRDEAVQVVEEIYTTAIKGIRKKAMPESANFTTVIAALARDILLGKGMPLPTDRKNRANFLEPIVLMAAEQAQVDLSSQGARKLAVHFARYPWLSGLLPLEPKTE